MVDSIMYQEDGYVVLENNQAEQLMTKEELLTKLKTVLQDSVDLPADVVKYQTLNQQAEYVLENYCEFNPNDDDYIQWYVVRWEKN